MAPKEKAPPWSQTITGKRLSYDVSGSEKFPGNCRRKWKLNDLSSETGSVTYTRSVYVNNQTVFNTTVVRIARFTPPPGIQNLIFRIGIDGLRRLIYRKNFFKDRKLNEICNNYQKSPFTNWRFTILQVVKKVVRATSVGRPGLSSFDGRITWNFQSDACCGFVEIGVHLGPHPVKQRSNEQ